MKKSTGLMLFMSCLGLIGVTGAVVASSSTGENVAFATQYISPNGYICDGYEDGISTLPIDTNPSTRAKMSFDNYDITFKTNSYHTNTETVKSGLPLRIGKGKGQGSLEINFKNGKECDKVMIYATGWIKDSDPCLVIGDQTQNVNVTTADDTNYNFNLYTFEFNKTKQIVISNGHDGETDPHRVLISKIVFRLY